MATASTPPPLHVLRGILRLTKSAPPSAPVAAPATQSPPSTSTSSSSLRQHIIAQYRRSRSLPSHQANTQRKIAHDYYMLRKNLTERARLLALDQGADMKLSPKELSRRAAARAGLQLPEMASGDSTHEKA